MVTIQATIRLPARLWRAVQALATQEGDTNTVILRALEEYITARKRRIRQRPGKYQQLVQALSTPVAELHLSVRAATAMRTLNVRYVYELVQKSRLDFLRLPNFGEKSLREVQEKLANLGVTLGMTLDDESYSAAVVATVAANIHTRKG